MDLITCVEEAEIHREAYVAIIHGFTRKPGAKRALARRAGITPEYLSYLLVVDTDPERVPVTRRRASTATARRIAAALPAPRDLRQQALEHMLAAGDAGDRLSSSAPMREDAERLVDAVRHAAHHATHAVETAAARVKYRVIANAGRVIARRMSKRAYPKAYVELCLCLHDALCVLDDPASALTFARRAEIVLGWLDPAVFAADEVRMADVETNVLRAVGVAYSNLDLPGKAGPYFDRASASRACVERPRDWIAHLTRDRLSVLSKTSRLRLSEIEGLADRANHEMGDAQRELHGFLLRAKLGDCYLAHPGGMRRAGRLLDGMADEAQASHELGPLHRAIVFRTYARLCRRRGDAQEASRWYEHARLVAQAGGLTNQLRRLHLEQEEPLP